MEEEVDRRYWISKWRDKHKKEMAKFIVWVYIFGYVLAGLGGLFGTYWVATHQPKPTNTLTVPSHRP